MFLLFLPSLVICSHLFSYGSLCFHFFDTLESSCIIRLDVCVSRLDFADLNILFDRQVVSVLQTQGSTFTLFTFCCAAGLLSSAANVTAVVMRVMCRMRCLSNALSALRWFLWLLNLPEKSA